MPGRIDTSSSHPTRPFGISQTSPEPRTSVVSVEGELDLSTAPRLKRVLHEAQQAGAVRLVADLTLVTFMDSTALGVLVGLKKGLEGDASSRLAIACAQANVLRIFEFSGLDGAFAIFPTLEEALAYVREREAWAS
jgi:anti-sigma B factor antagonist